MSAPPKTSQRRTRLVILSLLLVLVVLLIALIPEPGGAFPVSIEKIETNELGQAVYSFHVENRAWDCYVNGANLRVHRGNGVWTGEDHLAQRHDGWTRIPKGQSATFQITAPTNVWRVRFAFHRTHIPRFQQSIESLFNHWPNKTPRFARVERFIAVDTVEIDPASPPQLGEASREVRSDKERTAMVRLRTGEEWRKEGDRSNRGK